MAAYNPKKLDESKEEATLVEYCKTISSAETLSNLLAVAHSANSFDIPRRLKEIPKLRTEWTRLSRAFKIVEPSKLKAFSPAKLNKYNRELARYKKLKGIFTNGKTLTKYKTSMFQLDACLQILQLISSFMDAWNEYSNIRRTNDKFKRCDDKFENIRIQNIEKMLRALNDGKIDVALVYKETAMDRLNELKKDIDLHLKQMKSIRDNESIQTVSSAISAVGGGVLLVSGLGVVSTVASILHGALTVVHVGATITHAYVAYEANCSVKDWKELKSKVDKQISLCKKIGKELQQAINEQYGVNGG